MNSNFKWSTLFIVVVTSLYASLGAAKLVTEKIEYKENNQELVGFMVYDTAKVKLGKAPGVVVVHDWMGVGDYVKSRAEQMAGLGFVAFVADIYGKDNQPKDAKQAGELAGKFKAGDRKMLRARAEAALIELKKSKFVDANKISAMGYCFGGTTVLEMGRMGLPLAGVVSFHGGLAAGDGGDGKNIKAKVLVLHGAIDPYVKAEEVNGFQKEMNDAGVDYQFVAYSGAVHAFTQPMAGSDIKAGAAYNATADKRSFAAMETFFQEINTK
jgi:dienelactone hydrolase